MKFSINDRLIGSSHPPYIIAELSANHNGSIETAKKIISEAAKAGADAVKLQTYTADTITLKSQRPEFLIKGGLWDGRTLYDLYEEAHTPWEWHSELFQTAKNEGIDIFSSPFDHTAVDFLEELGAPAFKVASFEMIDTPLIEKMACTGKPLIISTGMANPEEIQDALKAAEKAAGVVLLHCVSGYPAPASAYGLKRIPDMMKRFKTQVGLSDHTLDNATAIASVALGATVIEKHFTLDRNGGGPDDSFSLEPEDLKRLCQDTKTAWEACQDASYGPGNVESGNIQFRRSLYFVKSLSKGERITSAHIRSVRPGFGVPPKLTNQIIGAKSTRDIEKDTPVKHGDWEL